MNRGDGIVEATAINIDALLVRSLRNRVAKLGVELEGGWKRRVTGVSIEEDMSVFKHVRDDAACGRMGRLNYPGIVFGEIPVGPIQPAYLKKAFTKYYPDLIDATCGLHVHMSFDRTYHYTVLADSPTYQETVCEYLKRWAVAEGLPPEHCIWGRLQGNSDYAQKKFWPQAQMGTVRKDHDKVRYGHRYTAIHYGYGRYRTVECRLLPMFTDQAVGVRAVKQLIAITNAYLLASRRVKVHERGSVVLPMGGTTISLECAISPKRETVSEDFDE